MSTKGIAKQFVDDTTAEILDHTYRLAKKEYGNKKEAEKLVKYIVKIVVKIGILVRNEQFNNHEVKLVNEFQQKFRNVMLTVISFHEVEFTFDQHYLTAQVKSLEDLLQRLVSRHLSEKSQKRITLVFGFFQRYEFLDKLFDGIYKEDMGLMIKCLNKLLEEDGV